MLTAALLSPILARAPNTRKLIPALSPSNLSTLDLTALEATIVPDANTINYYLEWFTNWLGAPRGTLAALARIESNYNAETGSFLNVRNHVGATGLMQLMDIARADIRQHYGANIDPYNPIQSIVAAALMFVINYTYLTRNNVPNISWAALVVAYNGGWTAGRTYAQTGIAPSDEGRNYVAQWQSLTGQA